MRTIKLILPLLICLLFSFVSCTKKEKKAEISTYDLPQIKEKGELTVLTLNSSLSYFKYRGEEMGFQFELARQFANSMNLKLKVKVAKNNTDLLKMLLNGEGDLIAYNFPVTKEFKDSINFCGEDIITHQVLIQRNSKEGVIKNVTEMIGKEIYLKPGKYLNRLNNLDKELGGGLIINAVYNDSISTEDLIQQVASGQIDYSISDNDMAQLNKTYYPNLNIDLAVSFDQRGAWGVRKNMPMLEEAANKWHKEILGTKIYKDLIRKYFEITKTLAQRGSILSLKDGKISHYDKFFKSYSKNIDWDWRLLAALAYTESNFDANAVSWAGAKGLMQLMPSTARKMGIHSGKEHDPEESIKAAVKYIGLTNRIFKEIKNPRERTKFILAAYNAGVGHITDAMALAEKYGKNKYLWEGNVAEYMLLKSNEEYYNDPVCKNGYFRGKETYNFVQNVLEVSEMYKKKIKH